MALTRNGNTLYAPAGESNTDYAPTNNKAMTVYAITVTTSAAGGSVVLFDGGTSNKKLSLKVAVDENTESFHFNPPLHFPNGIRITTTDAEATLVISQAGT